MIPYHHRRHYCSKIGYNCFIELKSIEMIDYLLSFLHHRSIRAKSHTSSIAVTWCGATEEAYGSQYDYL